MFTKFATPQDAMAYVLGKSYRQPLGKAVELDMRKSWTRQDGSLGFEGWISTPKKDIEKDIVEPESFSGAALKDYMRRGAPVSIDHNTRTIPVGYLMKSMLVRDGRIIQLEHNPKQPTQEDWRAFEGGTGWYAMGAVFDPRAALGIQKGVLSSFSWLGMPVDWEKLDDGGKHFSKPGSINPLLESTLTAYPINTDAVLRIAKSYGVRPYIDRAKVAELLANPLVVEAVVDILVPPGTASAVIEEQLKQVRGL